MVDNYYFNMKKRTKVNPELLKEELTLSLFNKLRATLAVNDRLDQLLVIGYRLPVYSL